jgi:catechol 2,3-dioxygenase-like lactoylglutathione lyase family enzyme
MNLFSETLRLSWADPWEGTIPILSGEGSQAPIVAFTLSREGPPHLELIRSVAQTVWEQGPGWHHIGYWADDFDQAVDAMESRGLSVEVMSPTADFSYLRSPGGARFELVNGRARPDFARWLRGGPL